MAERMMRRKKITQRWATTALHAAMQSLSDMDGVGLPGGLQRQDSDYSARPSSQEPLTHKIMSRTKSRSGISWCLQ
ncbi:hypothetical protein DPEC_G00104980 [Dallia pectoralis]|uniref:Uncharacterized protein n=1 Tax=Dallia pectoralis TaxID=75939 RepID=A0ACC2GYR8_DALPE|nr:hypothetical protein DPEC_G00104980 [Dallia pectoralis]